MTARNATIFGPGENEHVGDAIKLFIGMKEDRTHPKFFDVAYVLQLMYMEMEAQTFELNLVHI